jgi:hypothetical protein
LNFRLVYRLFRISGLIRLLWVAVAALHAWLLVERLFTGALQGPMDYVKAFLCLAAIGYATLKVWQIATFFDSKPRRVVAFTLLLMLGHWLVASPQDRTAVLEHAPSVALLTLAILPTLALGLALTCAAVALQRRRHTPANHMPRPTFLSPFELPPWAHVLSTAPPNVWRRPPPSLA